jgi:polar amino acid transport system substrate-binding protein
MTRVLYLTFLAIILCAYFIIVKTNNSDIKEKMRIEAKVIAQSSKIFLDNLAFDELKDKIKRDMNVRNIRAIEIRDFAYEKKIIVAYKDLNHKIHFTDSLPLEYQQYSQIREIIVNKRNYTTTTLGELTLYYGNNSDFNVLKNYDKLNFSKEEELYISNKKKITMCIDPDWMPFEEIKNNKHRGITADYVNIFRQLLGIPIELVLTSTWNESLTKAKNRECDIFSLVSKTEERESYMDFTTPYINSPIVIATKIGIPFIENLDQIIDKKVAVVRGYSLFDILKRDYPALDVYEVDSLSDGLQAVENNKIFAYIDNSTVINHAIQKDFLRNITISGKIKYNLEFSIATRNDEPILNNIFEAMVLSINKNTKNIILHKWIKLDYTIERDYSLVVQILLISLLIIFGIIYSNRKLSILNKELEKERDKANKLANTKSEFLANMSHEIRTPMNGILGMSHLALRCNLDAKSKNYIQKIDKSAKLLLSIINEILDFSKMEAGKLSIENVKFSLNDIIEDVISLTETKINEKNLKLLIYNETKSNTVFFGDSFRLTQILMNIMSNAIKFTEVGSVTLCIKNKEDDKLEFSVIDTGIGLSTSQIDKLFKPFTQGDASITRKYGGTGLGLYISKQLVELLDGTIWVESKENKGSVFLFEIPLPQRMETIEPKVDNQKIQENQRQFLNQKILVVDDNEINQEIIKGLLEDSGILTTQVYNGKEAIDEICLNPYKYNLILMDMKMPVMSGLEASEIIRKHNTTIPIVVITANTLPSDKEIALASGINDYLHKPIDVNQLYSILNQYLPEFSIGMNQVLKTDFDILNDFQYIDVKSGLVRLNGNKKLYLQILKDFNETYKNIYFKSLYEKDIKIKIHTLKGLSGNIGANDLYKTVLKIESEENEELLSSLNDRLREVITELSSISNIEDCDIEKKLITEVLKNELFDELRDALEYKRPKKIITVIEKIKLYRFSEVDRVLLDKIKLYITKYKYKEALSLLDL